MTAPVEVVFRGKDQSLTSTATSAQRALQGLANEERKLAQSADQASRSAGLFSRAMSSMGGQIVSATAGMATFETVIGQVGKSFNLVATLERNEKSLSVFMGSQEKASSIMVQATAFADKYKIKQSEISEAVLSSSQIFKSSQQPIEAQLSALTRLGNLQPSEGIRGAAFALKELISGDVTSLVERFNLSRDAAYKMRDAIAAGQDPIAVLDSMLNGMGATSDLLTARLEGPGGKMIELEKAVEDAQIAFGNLIAGPASEFLGFLTKAADGVTVLSNLLGGLGGSDSPSALWSLIPGGQAIAQLTDMADSLSEVKQEADGVPDIIQTITSSFQGMLPPTTEVGIIISDLTDKLSNMIPEFDGASKSAIEHMNSLIENSGAAQMNAEQTGILSVEKEYLKQQEEIAADAAYASIESYLAQGGALSEVALKAYAARDALAAYALMAAHALAVQESMDPRKMTPNPDRQETMIPNRALQLSREMLGLGDAPRAPTAGGRSTGGGAGGRRKGGSGKSDTEKRLKEEEKALDRLEEIHAETAEQITEIEQDAADQILAIDKQLADERWQAAKDLYRRLDDLEKSRIADMEGNDLDLVGAEGEERQRLEAREKAEDAALERQYQAQREAYTAEQQMDAETAQQIYDARQQQNEQLQQLEEDYLQKRLELANNPELQAELDREYQEAVDAYERQAQQKIDIAKMEYEDRKEQIIKEKEEVIANAEEQKNQVIAKAQAQALEVQHASQATRDAVISDLESQKLAYDGWATAVEAAAQRARAAMEAAARSSQGLAPPVGGSSPPSSSRGGIPEYDVGTPFHPGGMAKVHAGEFLRVPRDMTASFPRGTQVLSRSESERVAQGGGGHSISIAIDARGATGINTAAIKEELKRTIKEVLRETGIQAANRSRT